MIKLKISAIIILFIFLCPYILAQQKYDIEEPTTEQPEEKHPNHPPYQYTPWPLLFTGATTIIPLYAVSSKLKPSEKVSAATSSHDNYKIAQAIHDAATYVASNGNLNSAYLEQALILLRKRYPNTSDMELAKAILAY